MDLERRKKVENAAQKRLMDQYCKDGWTVKDTRYGNPYDAIAGKDGEVVYLEAKGTETVGRTVLLKRGEAAHARANPGCCVIGILSDVLLNADGEVLSGPARFESSTSHQ